MVTVGSGSGTVTCSVLLMPWAVVMLKGLTTRNEYEPAAASIAVAEKAPALLGVALPTVTQVLPDSRCSRTPPVGLGETLPVTVTCPYTAVSAARALTTKTGLTTRTCRVAPTPDLAPPAAPRTTRSSQVPALLGALTWNAKVLVALDFWCDRVFHEWPSKRCSVTVAPARTGVALPLTINADPTCTVARSTAAVTWVALVAAEAGTAAAGTRPTSKAVSAINRNGRTRSLSQQGLSSGTQSERRLRASSDRDHSVEAGYRRRGTRLGVGGIARAQLGRCRPRPTREGSHHCGGRRPCRSQQRPARSTSAPAPGPLSGCPWWCCRSLAHPRRRRPRPRPCRRYARRRSTRSRTTAWSPRSARSPPPA